MEENSTDSVVADEAAVEPVIDSQEEAARLQALIEHLADRKALEDEIRRTEALGYGHPVPEPKEES